MLQINTVILGLNLRVSQPVLNFFFLCFFLHDSVGMAMVWYGMVHYLKNERSRRKKCLNCRFYTIQRVCVTFSIVQSVQ